MNEMYFLNPVDARIRDQKRMENNRDRQQQIKDRKDTLAKQAAGERLIGNTWDSLAGMGLKEEETKKALMKQKRVCNRLFCMGS